MSNADVSDPLLNLRVGCHADEELEFAVCGAQPQVRNEAGEHDSAHRVDPPAQAGAADRSEQTEAVDEKVVAMIFPQDADLRVYIPERPAIAE